MLINPAAEVPVEISAVQNGTLLARTTFGYVNGTGGAVVRRFAHDERAVPEISGARAITDIEMTNVTVPMTNVTLPRGGVR